MFILTICGLVVATAIGLAEQYFNLGHERYGRGVFLALYLVALLIAGYGSYQQEEEKNSTEIVARERHDAIAAQLVATQGELNALQSVSAVTNALVGDLTQLNALGGGGKYSVRVAANTSPDGLERYLRAIEKQFGGARSSGLVAIRPPKAGSKQYTLVFGQGLTLASAEVFQRLAMSHHFPPDNQVAAIQQDE